MANTADKENYGVIMLHKKGLKLLHCRNMWCLLCTRKFYYCWTLNCRFCFEWGRLFWATSMIRIDVMVVVGVEVEVGWLVEKICSPKKLLLSLQQLPLAVDDLFRGEQ